MKSRDISQADKILSYHAANGKVRLMTVIDGIPFYQSTGDNSKHPGTWFPFRGIKHTGWIMKPTNKDKNNIPKEVLDQMEKLGINDDFVIIKRFGSINTMCISAQIGLGFWKTEKGAKLKAYLDEYYHEYLVNDDVLNEIAKQKKDYEPFDDLHEVNERLNELGSIIPHDCSDSRVFLLQEISLYKSLSDIPNMQMIFQQVNAAFVEPPRELLIRFSDFIEVLHKANLLEYAIKYYMFESEKQIRMLFKLVKDKGEAITLSDLEGITLIKEYIDKIDMDKNNKISSGIKLEKYEVRKALQRLASISGEVNADSVIKQHIDLIALMDKHGCLQGYMNILDKSLCVNAILNFPTPIVEEKLVDYIGVIYVLYKEKLFNENYIDYDPVFYDALNILNGFDMINKDTVLFIETLYSKNLLKENMNIFNVNYSRLLLNEIPEEVMLLSDYSLFSSEDTCDLLFRIKIDKELSPEEISELSDLLDKGDKNIELIAISLAIRYAQLNTLEMLLKRDISTELSEDQMTRLMRIGIKENNLLLIEYALERAPQLKLTDKFLELILVNGEENSVKLKPIFTSYVAPYLIKKMRSTYIDWMELLSNVKDCLNEKVDAAGNTLLHFAIKERNYDAVMTLLFLGADVSIKNAMGQTCKELTSDAVFLGAIEKHSKMNKPVESEKSTPPAKAFFEAEHSNTTAHATGDPALESNKIPTLPMQKKQ